MLPGFLKAPPADRNERLRRVHAKIAEDKQLPWLVRLTRALLEIYDASDRSLCTAANTSSGVRSDVIW